jgi:Na(+)-translocating NADH:ubiquinone oxidoreductase D subunit
MSDQVQLRTPKPGYRLFKTKSWAVFSEGLWHNNPIFGMVLGLCSTLAVTNLLVNALVMSVSVTVILVLNSLIISLMRKIIPERVRMITYMILISSFVIAVDMVLRIALPSISKALGPYVALIITNCIIMGRSEAYAINNPVGLSVVDALGVGLGYSFALLSIGLFRELLGFGSFFGIELLPEGAQAITLFTIPPGAFFALGIFILVTNTIRKGRK